MSELPKVSVVMPVYRPGQEIEAAIGALLAIDYPSIEFIIVDDGSGDDTPDIIARALAEDERATLISIAHNQGAGVARNIGLAEATGDYVWFVDWDDVWNPAILRRLVAAAVESHAGIAICRGRWSRNGELGDITDGLPVAVRLEAVDALGYLLTGQLKGYLWTKLFRREVLGESPFPAISTQEDICGVARVLSTGTTVMSIPDVLYSHVVRGGSLSNSVDPVLHNLSIARDVVHSVAVGLGLQEAHAWKLTYYDYAYWMFARATTAIRLSDRLKAAGEVGSVRRMMRLSELPAVARGSMSMAIACALLKVLGTRFIPVRAAALRTRRTLRAVSERGTQGTAARVGDI